MPFSFLALGVSQLFLAAFGAFGEGDAYKVHGSIGWLLGLIALVLLVLALLGRREAAPASALLFGLMIIQIVLGTVGYDVTILGALHGVNALLVLGAASGAAAGSPPPFGGQHTATPPA